MTRGSLCFLYLRNVRRPMWVTPNPDLPPTCLIVAGSAGHFRTVTAKEQTPVTSAAGFRDASSPRTIHDWLVSPSERKYRSWLAHHLPRIELFSLFCLSINAPVLRCKELPVNSPDQIPFVGGRVDNSRTSPLRLHNDSIGPPSQPCPVPFWHANNCPALPCFPGNRSLRHQRLAKEHGAWST